MPLSPARRFVGDVLHFARQVPSLPLARTMQLARVLEARQCARPRPSWVALFMKAYGLVSGRRPQLRRAYIRWPRPHLYEHPHSVCGVTIEREYCGETIVLPAQIRGPENQPLAFLAEYLNRCKTAPVGELGYFRAALRVGRLPQPVRRFLWWSTLQCSGYKRAKRLGTFLLTTIGRLGVEQLHPISPLTTTLTFGPVSDTGEVVVKIIYDHRVLDGAEVARCLGDLEQTLVEEITAELREMADFDDAGKRDQPRVSRPRHTAH